MAAYNFKKRFVPMIMSGEKRHTIRAKRKRRTKQGELCHLFTGMRQKGCQLLMRAVCTRVQDIEIAAVGGWVLYEPKSGSHVMCPAISIDGENLILDECERLAKSDGFDSFAEMMGFWEGRLPFRGDIIHWNFPPEVWGAHTQVQEKRTCANVSAQDANKPSRAAIVSAQRNAAAPTTTRSAKNSATKSAPVRNRAPHAGSR